MRTNPAVVQCFRIILNTYEYRSRQVSLRQFTIKLIITSIMIKLKPQSRPYRHFRRHHRRCHLCLQSGFRHRLWDLLRLEQVLVHRLGGRSRLTCTEVRDGEISWRRSIHLFTRYCSVSMLLRTWPTKLTAPIMIERITTIGSWQWSIPTTGTYFDVFIFCIPIFVYVYIFY